ncbi:MAG: hypothetical protein U0527_03455 [Candidatus Eisenbacteria bacterium]
MLWLWAWVLACGCFGCASLFHSKATTEPPREESIPAPKKAASPSTPHETATPVVAAPVTAEPAKPPAAPPLTPSLTPEERSRLEGEVADDVRATSARIETIDRAALSTSELDQLRAAEALLVAVAEAKKSDDVTAAARLAHKARLLVEELGR